MGCALIGVIALLMDVFAAKRLHDFFNVELSVVSKYQHTGLHRVSLSQAATALRVIPA